MNGLNILEVSLHFLCVLARILLPISSRYKISEKDVTWWYYISNGVYRPWRIFVKSLTLQEMKSRLFNRNVEVICMCVVLMSGVL